MKEQIEALLGRPPTTATDSDDYIQGYLAGWERGINACLSIVAKPIDMVLHCPRCHTQHIDAPEESPCKRACQHAQDSGMPEATCAGPCAYLQPGSPRWTNPPHRSHLCAHCGHVWRPADVPTNGVAATQTSGKDDSPRNPS